MPSRVIRGEINSSESLSRVSIGADLTFRALIVAVDDYGRLDARPDALKAALFPMRPMATSKKIASWLGELAADGCVQLYEADGRPYLALTGWEKHRGNTKRGKLSRFPDPPDPQDPQGIRSGVGVGVGVESRSRDKERPGGALCLCPETLVDDDLEKLESWADQNGFRKQQVKMAFERVRDWSHTSRKKRARWWVVTKNAMQDGWALKGGGNGKPSKSWAQQQEDETLEWLRGVSDGTDRKSLGTGAGAAVPDVSERSDGGDQDDIPF